MVELVKALDRRLAPDADFLVEPRVTVDNPDLWRIAARIVGKRRGWRVRTGANARCVWMTNLREPGPSRGDGSLTHRLEVLIDWQIGRGPEVGGRGNQRVRATAGPGPSGPQDGS